MDGLAALRERSEYKFVLPTNALHTFLQLLANHYYVLQIDDNRQFNYVSWYFDTPDMRLYHDHARGYERRIKVRQRLYTNTGACFFEVKQKKGNANTNKTRMRIEALRETLTAAEQAMIVYKDLNTTLLQLTAINNFSRVTLCHKTQPERVTIDTGICTTHNGQTFAMNGIAIVEVKQHTPHLLHTATQCLRQMGFHSGPFSKYASAVAAIGNVKYNNLKPQLLKIKQYATT